MVRFDIVAAELAATASLALAGALGCTPGVQIVQGYPGAERPLAEVAVLEPDAFTVVESVDGDAAYRCHGAHCVLRLLPGAHQLRVSHSGYDVQSREPRSFDVELGAGESYWLWTAANDQLDDWTTRLIARGTHRMLVLEPVKAPPGPVVAPK
jgi:hypothetical protein